jgi:hypothetical protein
MIRGIYLQPDLPTLFDGTLSALLFHRSTGDTPAIVQRLAQQIGVDFKGLTLVGKKGERVSVLCVETLPTLENQGAAVATGRSLAGADGCAPATSFLQYTAATADSGVRPLSDALGHVRILRTSPLTPVPEVC